MNWLDQRTIYHIYIILRPFFYFIGACTVPEISGCTLLGETPQQISANHVIAFACNNNATSNVTAFGATLMRCRENGTWEEVKLDYRGLTKCFCVKHRLLICTCVSICTHTRKDNMIQSLSVYMSGDLMCV